MRKKRNNLDKKLLAYSLAAGATLACRSEGTILHFDVNLQLEDQPGQSLPFSFDFPSAPSVVFGLQLNQFTGTNTFGVAPNYNTNRRVHIENILKIGELKASFGFSQYASVGITNYFKVFPLNAGNNVQATPPGFNDYGLLGYQDVHFTGPNPVNGTFVPTTTFIDFQYGNFINVTEKFIGLQVESEGDFFFGWIRVSTDFTGIGLSSPNPSITIHDWAWQDTPNVSIGAGIPEPGNLGLLAAGAAGLMAWRRRRRETAKDHAETVPEKA